MMGTTKPCISIIGTGALGSTLQKFFSENGYLVYSTWNSSGSFIYDSKTGEYQPTASVLPQDAHDLGGLVFITTPDDLISKTAESLSKRRLLWDKRTVVHCSGNLTTDVLNALSEKGAKTASMHPIQTFKKGDGDERFNDIYISLQGDPEAKELLKPVIQEMGANCIVLDKKQKRYMHIAAVMASNYLVALMYSVENLLKDAELAEGFNSLETLMHQTVTNIFEKGPSNALTGPVSRGDTESVETHLHELRGKEQEKLYKILGMEALKLAKQAGKLSAKNIEELAKLFEN